MKLKIGQLRKLIREAIDDSTESSSNNTGGFYPYEIERGVDIHGYWYRSPGRAMGGDGDPGRPEDAASYIGMKPPVDDAINSPGESAVDSSTSTDGATADLGPDVDVPIEDESTK